MEKQVTFFSWQLLIGTYNLYVWCTFGPLVLKNKKTNGGHIEFTNVYFLPVVSYRMCYKLVSARILSSLLFDQLNLS